MANTTSAQPSSTSVQPIFYRKTSLITTSGTAYNANEPNLLPDAKCPVYATTDSTQPASNEFESKINVKVNR
ncbi:unnamed protein product [Trichobilharzia regenti]|nr:unnamed protein product [Trichobilharzia regenti]